MSGAAKGYAKVVGAGLVAASGVVTGGGSWILAGLLGAGTSLVTFSALRQEPPPRRPRKPKPDKNGQVADAEEPRAP